MLFFALGLGTLALLLGAGTAFANASVANVKQLLAWVAALAGLLLVAMLLLTGRGGLALSGLVLAGPLVWSWWRDGLRPGPNPRRPASTRMSRAEAHEVLGLKPGASDSEIREAWVRLMRTAHPDGGGSDWLAARVNQARDTLLRSR